MDQDQQPRASALREAHLRDYWKVVWQGRWTILAIFVVVVGVTAVWTFLQTPLYKATAIVEVQSQARRLMSGRDASGMGAAGYGWLAEEKYHNTQVEILKSRDVASRVVDSLGLRAHPQFQLVPDPVRAFRGRVRVGARRETGLIEVSIQGTDPKEITHWVNEVARQYVKRNLAMAQDNVKNSVQAIEDQIAGLQRDLSTAEEQRIDVLQDEELFNSENQQDILRQRLQTYHTEHDEVRIELRRLADNLQQIRAMRGRGEDVGRLPEFAPDKTLQELNTNRTDVMREIESLKVELRPGHPELRQQGKALDSIEENIEDRVSLLVGGLRDRYDLLASRESFLQEQINLAEQFSLQVAKATSRYNIVKTDADTKKRIFDLITGTMNEIQLSAQLMSNNVSVLDEAAVPLFPVKPRKRINLAMGMMMGMLLGVATVFFLDYLDNTIRTPEDVEKYLGLSVLGVVPTWSEEGLAQRAVKEAYASLRTSIIFSSKNRQRKIILITSTGPREGKSSTIANLSRALGAAGDRVVVIDCDLRKPKQHIHHGVEQEPGLTNFLAAPPDEHDWARYLQTAGKVSIMSCGPIPPSPPELLSNERFTGMLAEMRERFDWVLIDSPPASSLADASLLAQMAEMVVAVVQHNRTDRDRVVKTLNTLRAVNTSIAGVVLNNVNMDRAYHKDYYYAGYYYEEEDPNQKTRGRRSKSGLEHKAQVG